ncbi:MAG: hypothetical protein ACM3UN_04250, partial [Bacillota bacterium]
MKPDTKIIIAVVVVVSVVLVVGSYVFFNGAVAPLEQKEDKTIIAATQNVEIQADTFNGDIII